MTYSISLALRLRRRPGLHPLALCTLLAAAALTPTYAQNPEPPAGTATPANPMAVPPPGQTIGQVLPNMARPAPPPVSPGSRGDATPVDLNKFKAGEPVTLNFVNADIDAVARAIGLMTGRTMVIDPRVKGQLTMLTERPVSPALAYNQFLATLRLQGFTVVESAGLYKVVPEADAKLQGGSVSVGSVGNGGGQMQTQIFQLNYESANNLVPVLRPLISPNNTINVNPGTNALVITDYADNLQRIARIVAALDVSNASDLEVIPLKHAIASDLAPLVLKLIESDSAAKPAAGAAAGQTDSGFRTTLLADPASNSLILRAANPARMALVRSLIGKLDKEPAGDGGSTGNIYVVRLKNADATKLATILRATLAASGHGSAGAASSGSTSSSGSSLTSTGLQSSGMGGLSSSSGLSGVSGMPSSSGFGAQSGAGGSTPSLGGSSNQPSTGGQIQADPSTNTLIITAPEPLYRQLRAVIDKLDERRPQVYVECLVAEVNSNLEGDFGIQWQTPTNSTSNGVIGVIGTNYGVGGTNIISLATGAATLAAVPSTGINFGLVQKVNGVNVLAALARFFQSTGDGNVLSTPKLVTLDNEEAQIIVGQNLPFVTGQYTSTASTTNTVTPFQTIQRQDVGLTLRVKPQISENGTIKMSVYQEVSSLQAGTLTNAQGPSTNKRMIQSNVLVEDGGIVVLGGLLQDQYSDNVEKVPGLGDLPFFGNLFKSQTRTRAKTNLMVFLRPVVLRDAVSVNILSEKLYETMRHDQMGIDARPTSTIKVGGAAVMPAVGAKDSPTPAPTSTATPPAGAQTGTPSLAAPAGEGR